MKNVLKIFAVALAFLTLISSLTVCATAAAAAPEIKEVTISVSLNKDDKVGDWNEYISLHTNHVSLDSAVGDPVMVVASDDIFSSEPLSNDTLFTEGQTYSIMLSLKAEGDYVFAEDLDYVAINGIGYNDSKCVLDLDFDPQHITVIINEKKLGADDIFEIKEPIKTVDFELKPEPGTKIGVWTNYITANSGNLVFDSDSSFVDVYDASDLTKKLAYDDVFEEGKEYIIDAYLTAPAGYGFSNSLTSITINGNTVEKGKFQVNQIYTGEDYIGFAVQHSLVVEEEEVSFFQKIINFFKSIFDKIFSIFSF